MSKSYGYDATNQLTQDGAATYGYDASGNRTNTGYQKGAGNQMTSDGTWSYVYDAQGQVSKKTKGAGAETWYYGYDVRGHMTWAKQEATDGGTLLSLSTYVYDVLGNRIEKDVWTQASGITTVSRYAYDDAANAWADLNGSNALVMRRVFLDGANQPVARVDSGGTAAWYLADRQGSIRDVANFAGTLVLDRVAYDGFGKVLSETNATAGDAYKYNGGRLDAQTGYTLFGWRYYDASTGRWTTRDPIGLRSGDYDIYRYVGNDPTNMEDPSGLRARFDMTGAWSGLALGGGGGAVAGAFIGAPAFGVGAVPGAIIGGTIGGVAGFIAGGFGTGAVLEEDAPTWQKIAVGGGIGGVVGVISGIVGPWLLAKTGFCLVPGAAATAPAAGPLTNRVPRVVQATQQAVSGPGQRVAQKVVANDPPKTPAQKLDELKKLQDRFEALSKEYDELVKLEQANPSVNYFTDELLAEIMRLQAQWKNYK